MVYKDKIWEKFVKQGGEGQATQFNDTISWLYWCYKNFFGSKGHRTNYNKKLKSIMWLSKFLNIGWNGI